MGHPVEQQVFEQHQKIIAVAQSGNNAKIALGEFLLWMREADRYKLIAGEEATWTSYLASPEVKIPYSSADRYMRIAKLYIQEIGLGYEDLNGLDTWGLHYLAHKGVVNKKNVHKWLSNIKELSRSDIKHMVSHPDVDVMKCKHEFEKVKPKWRCKKCETVTIHNPDIV